jgi:hypothetical protein
MNKIDPNEIARKLEVENKKHYRQCIEVLKEHGYTELESEQGQNTPFQEYGPIRLKEDIDHIIVFRDVRRAAQRTNRSIDNLLFKCGVRLHSGASNITLEDIIESHKRKSLKRVKKHKTEVCLPNGQVRVYNNLKHFITDELPEHSTPNKLRRAYKHIRKNGGCFEGYKVTLDVECIQRKVIRHGCRADILMYLGSKESTGRLDDICYHIGKSERYVMENLKVLIESHLVIREKKWKVARYRINKENKNVVDSELSCLEMVA